MPSSPSFSESMWPFGSYGYCPEGLTITDAPDFKREIAMLGGDSHVGSKDRSIIVGVPIPLSLSEGRMRRKKRA
jgi:hypothetical protein